MSDQLRRYTNIPALLHILTSKSLTLLDPSKWDDTNDSYGMAQYKKKKQLRTLLALCFTKTSETYHHWHVFGKDAGGACITFNRKKLLRQLPQSKGYRFGSVEYKSLEDMREKVPAINDLPFVKRLGYQDEQEFRLVYENNSERLAAKSVSIDIACIDKIALSPWLPKALINTMRGTVASIDGCEHLGELLTRSSLTGNTEWKRLVAGI